MHRFLWKHEAFIDKESTCPTLNVHPSINGEYQKGED